MVVIVVDTSALVAVLFEEADQGVYEDVLATAGSIRMSAVNVFERCIVTGARDLRLLHRFQELVEGLAVEIIPFDAAAAQAAHDAYRHWGKGSGAGAKLNMGDCAAYALAMRLNVPLLYKGEDFARTDVRSALA